ncbi:MarR family winged helix-turn-helix transcriptional regulator [Pseudonocardia hispaniensis]|uniref:MarR family winged helix-turn-helix transcriptional regulator n=1 Tax=Pseudonocardia hispaniensis TaxID=904933 RepID=A0ABW1J892_9PSEU
MSGDLTFDLHVLTARLDRAAEKILQPAFGLTYRRFLTLLLVGELGPLTQRALAEALGVSEPSVSRMTGALAGTGLLEAGPDPAGGNRRRLALTPSGKQVVAQCRDLLERRFADVVERSGVGYATYTRDTRRLIAALDDTEDER